MNLNMYGTRTPSPRLGRLAEVILKNGHLIGSTDRAMVRVRGLGVMRLRESVDLS
jgi:hypothetical protein